MQTLLDHSRLRDRRRPFLRAVPQRPGVAGRRGGTAPHAPIGIPDKAA